MIWAMFGFAEAARDFYGKPIPPLLLSPRYMSTHLTGAYGPDKPELESIGYDLGGRTCLFFHWLRCSRVSDPWNRFVDR